MSDEQFKKEVEKLFHRITNSPDDIPFSELIEIAGLNPQTDLIGTDLSNVDFRGSDMSKLNLTNAKLTNAIFDD